MFRTMLCLIFTLSSLPSFAGEPFTIFAGKDGSVPKQPQACAAPDGTIHVTFGVGDQVYYCSISNDKSSTPQAAFQVPNMSLGMRRGPRIAHAGSSIVITAIDLQPGQGRGGVLQLFICVSGIVVLGGNAPKLSLFVAHDFERVHAELVLVKLGDRSATTAERVSAGTHYFHVCRHR